MNYLGHPFIVEAHDFTYHVYFSRFTIYNLRNEVCMNRKFKEI